jgi:hypothetical protein
MDSLSLLKTLLTNEPEPIGKFQKIRYCFANLFLPIILVWLTWFSYVTTDIFYKDLLAAIAAGLTSISIIIRFIEQINTQTIVETSTSSTTNTNISTINCNVKLVSIPKKTVTSDSHIVHGLIWLTGGQNKYDNGNKVVFINQYKTKEHEHHQNHYVHHVNRV